MVFRKNISKGVDGMSIDNATPEEWSNSNRRATPVADTWKSLEDWDGPNDHPLFGDTASVNNPPHYNNGNIECIEAIEAMLTPDEFVGYLRGNSLKYRWRFRYKKKPIEDLRKARWYEEKLMAFLMENQDVLG